MDGIGLMGILGSTYHVRFGNGSAIYHLGVCLLRWFKVVFSSCSTDVILNATTFYYYALLGGQPIEPLAIISLLQPLHPTRHQIKA